jgi:hypothetical protein
MVAVSEWSNKQSEDLDLVWNTELPDNVEVIVSKLYTIREENDVPSRRTPVSGATPTEMACNKEPRETSSSAAPAVSRLRRPALAHPAEFKTKRHFDLGERVGKVVV